MRSRERRCQVVTFNQHHATQVHVLTDLGDQVGDGQLNGLAVAEVGGFQRVNVSDLLGSGDFNDFLTHGQEAGILGNEVSLAVQLDHDGNVAFGTGEDHTFSGDTASFLGGFGLTGFAHVFDSQLDITVGFFQCFCNPSCQRRCARAVLLPGRQKCLPCPVSSVLN
jgi:hypothetical protein